MDKVISNGIRYRGTEIGISTGPAGNTSEQYISFFSNQ